MKTLLHSVVAFLVSAGWLMGQGLGNANLDGSYHFVHLEIEVDGPEVLDARNLAGTITFDGDGGYSFAAELLDNLGMVSPLQGSGDYEVRAQGLVRLSNPLRAGLFLSAALGADGVVVLGATSESPSPEAKRDLFVAIRGASDAGLETLEGAYVGSTLRFPAMGLSSYGSAVFTMAANGRGGLTEGAVTGHSRGGATELNEFTGASYTLASDGSGAASFGDNAGLLAGDRRLFASPDGAYIVGYSEESARDILIAVRRHTGSVNGFAGRYWVAEVLFDGADFTSGAGSMLPHGEDRVLVSERVRYDQAALDFSGLNFFAVGEGARGWLSNRVLEGVTNMGLGATEVDGQASALVGAPVGAVGAASEEFGIFLVVRAPELEGDGLFLNPAGIVNAASFASLPHPLAPGVIASLFGQSFTPPLGPIQLGAEQLPLPTRLLGLAVRINGQDVPLFFTSTGQVNFQVPYGLTGDSILVRVQQGAAMTPEITIPLAPTSPGVFSFVQPQSIFAAIATHLDGELVSLQRPAAPGETIVIYATGMGELEPAVPSGAANPGLSGEGVAYAVNQGVAVLFNREPGVTHFAGGAPGFAGLNQLNVSIPANVLPGDNVVVAVVTRNAFHDQVDIPIAGDLAGDRKALISSRKTLGLLVPPRSRRPN